VATSIADAVQLVIVLFAPEAKRAELVLVAALAGGKVLLLVEGPLGSVVLAMDVGTFDPDPHETSTGRAYVVIHLPAGSLAVVFVCAADGFNDLSFDRVTEIAKRIERRKGGGGLADARIEAGRERVDLCD
jgi:hypothetical protein